MSVNSACYSKKCYRVLYNGNLIEERNYEKGVLKNIVVYNLSESKDSIVYDGELKSYRYNGNDYSPNDNFPFNKYYYPDFDKSIYDNYLYGMIKSRVLLENIMWSLASMDNEIVSDSTGLFSNCNRIIKGGGCKWSIEYKNINIQCYSSGILQTYNIEKLQSLKIIIKNGALIKLLFKGEKTDKKVSFDYSNNHLQKEIIKYYEKGMSKPIYTEEYRFIQIGDK